MPEQPPGERRGRLAGARQNAEPTEPRFEYEAAPETPAISRRTGWLILGAAGIGLGTIAVFFAMRLFTPPTLALPDPPGAREKREAPIQAPLPLAPEEEPAPETSPAAPPSAEAAKATTVPPVPAPTPSSPASPAVTTSATPAGAGRPTSPAHPAVTEPVAAAPPQQAAAAAPEPSDITDSQLAEIQEGVQRALHEHPARRAIELYSWQGRLAEWERPLGKRSTGGRAILDAGHDRCDADPSCRAALKHLNDDPQLAATATKWLKRREAIDDGSLNDLDRARQEDALLDLENLLKRGGIQVRD